VLGMDTCARVEVELTAASASECAVVRDLARGAVREPGLGRLVPLFGEYVGKRGGLASPFGEYGMDMRPIAMLGSRDKVATSDHRSTKMTTLPRIDRLATIANKRVANTAKGDEFSPMERK
jgi:hypothetical protein